MLPGFVAGGFFCYMIYLGGSGNFAYEYLSGEKKFVILKILTPRLVERK